jgi:nitrite reductase/ring-hydroxylating ferredoxin subunit/Fe-S cluster biogenesis protein NfuA
MTAVVPPGVAAEHPRPASADAADLGAMVADLERLERVFQDWPPHERSAVAAYKRAVDKLHAEALRRLVRACKTEPAALATLRAAVTDDVVYCVMRQLRLMKPSLDERVEHALASVRPMLAQHGGDVELVRVAPPVIEVRLLGACDGCAASAMTFHAGVKQAVLEGCPEITDVIHIKSARGGRTPPAPVPAQASPLVSPFALGRAPIWRHACELADLADGRLHALAISGLELLLVQHADRVSCVANACAHLGLALDDGELAAGVLTCAHHGFQYDLATGACLTAPAVALTTYPARVIGTRVEVRLTR